MMTICLVMDSKEDRGSDGLSSFDGIIIMSLSNLTHLHSIVELKLTLVPRFCGDSSLLLSARTSFISSASVSKIIAVLFDR